MGAQVKGVMSDGTSRFRCRGETLFTFVGCSTFTEYSVMSEINVAKIDPAAPMDKAALISCGISTGKFISLSLR
jgi:S-(hydroxymethyl)glutathione dehydrogenase/alcohol dehydrogenase